MPAKVWIISREEERDEGGPIEGVYSTWELASARLAALGELSRGRYIAEEWAITSEEQEPSSPDTPRT